MEQENEVVEEALEEGIDEVPSTGDSDPVEKLASEMGWNPDWEGDDSERVSARDYILRGQLINRQASKDIKSLKGEIDSLQRNMKEMAVSNSKAVKAALDSQRERLMNERDAAIESGDVAAVRKYDEAIKKTETPAIEEESQYQSHPPGQPTREQQEAYKRAIDQFTSENHWFDPAHSDYDPYLRGQAVTIGTAIANGDPTMDPNELLDRTMAILKEKEPEYFASPSNSPNTFVSGSKKQAPKSNDGAWSKLKSEYGEEAVEGFKICVKRGVFKDTAADRERYAKEVLG